MKATPPRIPRLIAWLLPRRHREQILGDLCEEASRHSAGWSAGTVLRFWLQLIRSTVASWYHVLSPSSMRDGVGWPSHQSPRSRSMSHLRQDVVYAIRTMRRRPLFAVTVILTLSLGIGATTSMFTLVNGAILRPLPYDEPDALVHLQGTRRGVTGQTISYPDFVDYRAATDAFAGLSAWQRWEVTLDDDQGIPTRVRAASVSTTFFDLLRVRPAAGRFFTEAENRLGHPPAVVLSHSLWQRLFGGSDSAIGATLPLEDASYTVVGVAPPGFVDPVVAGTAGAQPQLWRVRPPVFDVGQAGRSWRGFWAIGRLRPGVGLEAARREAGVLAAQLEAAYPQSNTGRGFAITTFADALVGDARQPFTLLMVVVSLVLLIACANVTNLLLSRANIRRGEFAIRTALGAPRRRLVAQLLTESLLLAGTSAVGGLALALVGTKAILAWGGRGIPRADSIGIDGPVVAFTMGVSLATILLFGLVPALRLSAVGARSARDAGGRRRDRFRSGLVVAEVAMAIMILVSAGLVLKSLWRLDAVDAGMDIDGLLTVRVTPARAAYPTITELAPLMTGLEARLAATPGILAAGGISDLPMGGAVNSVSGRRDDRPPPPPGEGLIILIRGVTPTYFSAAGIAIRRGRDVTERDREDGEMVAVVNTALTDRLYPGEDPIGKYITTMGTSRRIIGVVGAVRQFGPGRPSEPAIYIPYAQIGGQEWMRRSVTFLVRTAGDPGQYASAVRLGVRSVDPTIPINDLQSMRSVLTSNVAAPRFRSLVFGLFAMLSLTLAAVGLGGVMAFNLSQRAREIAIRLAIGAAPGAVLRLLLWEGARLTLIGATLGLAASLYLSRLMAGVLFGVEPNDPLVLLTVTSTLAGVALLATYLPARKAMRVAPATVLQSE